MSMPIPIKIALANLENLENINDIYNYIEENSEDVETYQLDNSKVSIAAIDYITILNGIGSVASVAALLWMAYEKFIAPKKSNSDDTSGIYIVFPISEIKINEFWIGNTHKDKEKFIHDFTKNLKKFSRSKYAKKELENVIKDIQSGVWIKRK